MSASLVFTTAAVAAPDDLAGLWRAVRGWLVKNPVLALISASIGAVVGCVANIVLMGLVYDGYEKVVGGPATGKGNLITGSLIWLVGSTLVFTLFGYWRSVGTKRFLHDVEHFPATLGLLMQRDGAAARVHLLWGAAVSLVSSQIVSPWLGAVVGIAVVAAAPSLVGRVLSSLLFRAYSRLMARLAPTRVNPVTGPAAMTVALLGAATATGIGFFIIGANLKLVMGIGCAIAAWILTLRNHKPPSSAMFWLLVSLLAVFADLAIERVALAQDGGICEYDGLIDWISRGGALQLLPWAIPGAIAAAVGSAIGSGLAGALNEFAGEGGGGDDGESDEGSFDDGAPSNESEEGQPSVDDDGLPADEQPGDKSQDDGLPAREPTADDAKKQKLHEIIKQIGEAPIDDLDERAKLIQLVKDHANLDQNGIPQGPLDLIGRVVGRKLNPDAPPNTLDEIKQELKDIGRGVKDDLRDLKDAAVNKAKAIGHEAVEIGKDVWKDPRILTETFTGTKDTITRGVSAAGRATADAVKDVFLDPSILTETWEGTKNDINKGLEKAGGFVAQAGRDAIDATKDVLKDPRIIGDAFGGTISDLQNLNKVEEAIKQLPGGKELLEATDKSLPTTERLWKGLKGAADWAGAADALHSAGEIAQGMGSKLLTKLGGTGGEALEGLAEEGAVSGRKRSSFAGPADEATEAEHVAKGEELKARKQVAEAERKARVKRLTEDGGTRTQQTEGPTLRDPNTRYSPANLSPEQMDQALAGMPDKNIKHAQNVADKYGVEIQVRPTNADAKALLESGEGYPKPECIKMKTITNVDVQLGATADGKGKVGYFEPKMPEGVDETSEAAESLRKRFTERTQEFQDQRSHVEELLDSSKVKSHERQIEIINGVVHDAKTGKPFCGDHDLFDIRGANGEELPKAVRERVINDLKKSPFEVQHGDHMSWDYSKLSRENKSTQIVADKYGVKIPTDADALLKKDHENLLDIRGTNGEELPKAVREQVISDLKKSKSQSPYDIARNIDEKIQTGHSPRAKNPEPLITFGPRDAPGGPGLDPPGGHGPPLDPAARDKVTGSLFTGEGRTPRPSNVDKALDKVGATQEELKRLSSEQIRELIRQRLQKPTS